MCTRRLLAPAQVIIEIPSFFLDVIYQAYGNEPDVKFLLTERDPDAWVRSATNGPAELLVALDTPGPLGLSRHFDAFNDEFFNPASLMYESMAEGKGPEDPGAQAALRRHYVKYIAKAKATAPSGKLHVIKLEEGLDWESICPFLGCEVPSEPYPRGNDRGEFTQMMGAYMAPGINKAVMGVSAVVVPLIGLGAWALVRQIWPAPNEEDYLTFVNVAAIPVSIWCNSKTRKCYCTF
ncbi:uncharacterized protein PG986_003352 [Apiospora aurea]|uniref:Uncharacterized protein n=1 Tax=Apiospora aurea TaxID=335848 RepID=A0ABR1QRF3_9PEZI